jgi:hypothetical protein
MIEQMDGWMIEQMDEMMLHDVLDLKKSFKPI